MEEFVKKKRGFSQEQSHIQNPLSFFTQVSWFGRYKHIFTAHFFRFENSGISCFSHHLWARLRGDEEVF
jgi:hypothetical protein